MTIYPEDIRDAQRNGWVVVAVDEDQLVLRCPAQGCGVKMRYAAGADVPSCDPGLRRNPGDIPIGSFFDLRDSLRERRRELRLNISEVEEAAGFSSGHVVKYEKLKIDNNHRVPTIENAIIWAKCLGMEVVLRPTDLPKITTSTVINTRHLSERRKKFNDRQAKK